MVWMCTFYGQKGMTPKNWSLKAPEPQTGKQLKNWRANFKMDFLKKRHFDLAETLYKVGTSQDQPQYTHQTS